jgi:trehalose-phosphatase
MTLHPIAERVRRAREEGRPTVLLFDYDGTLAPYADDPSQARMPPTTRRLLARLAGCPSVAVGFVSGRSLADLRSMADLAGVYYAGCGGLEMDMLGVRLVHPDAAAGRALLDAVEPGLRGLCQGYPGTWAERKPLGLSLHYRHLVGVLHDGFRSTVREVLASRRRLSILDCALALEVTPSLGWTKGSAVRAVAGDVGPGGLVFYAGDEANDADAFAAAAGLGGVSVGIGPRAPATAQYRLPDPEALVELLGQFLGVLSAEEARAAVE